MCHREKYQLFWFWMVQLVDYIANSVWSWCVYFQWKSVYNDCVLIWWTMYNAHYKRCQQNDQQWRIDVKTNDKQRQNNQTKKDSRRLLKTPNCFHLTTTASTSLLLSAAQKQSTLHLFTYNAEIAESITTLITTSTSTIITLLLQEITTIVRKIWYVNNLY